MAGCAEGSLHETGCETGKPLRLGGCQDGCDLEEERENEEAADVPAGNVEHGHGEDKVMRGPGRNIVLAVEVQESLVKKPKLTAH